MYKNYFVIIQLIIFFSCFVSVPVRSERLPAIEYAHVSAIEVTTEKSAIARNAILGGLVGVAIGDNTASAFHGAAAAFAITSIIEGDRRVFLYTLSLVQGGSKNIAIHTSGLSVGQCVAFEHDEKHTNLRPVSAVYCQSAEHKALTSANVVKAQQSIANACNKAIAAVHNAKNDEGIDAALIQMRALCE